MHSFSTAIWQHQGETLIVVSGGFSGAPLNSNYFYSPKNDSWIPLGANLTIPRYRHASEIVFNNDETLICVFGGRNFSIEFDNVECIDLLNFAKNNLSSLPGGVRYGLSSCTYQNVIYLMGGWNGSTSLNFNHAFFPSNNSYQTRSSIPGYSSAFHSSNLVANEIWLTGGLGLFFFFLDFQIYLFRYFNY